MEYRYVDINESVAIPVSAHFTAQQASEYIASRIAYVNLQELEADCRESLHLWEQGKLVPLADVLSQLKTESGQEKSA